MYINIQGTYIYIYTNYLINIINNEWDDTIIGKPISSYIHVIHITWIFEKPPQYKTQHYGSMFFRITIKTYIRAYI